MILPNAQCLVCQWCLGPVFRASFRLGLSSKAVTAFLTLILLFLLFADFTQRSARAEPTEITAFELRQVGLKVQSASRLAQAGKLVEAEFILSRAIDTGPALPDMHYKLAVLRAQLGKSHLAIHSLAAAVEQGLRDVATLERDARLAALRTDPRFAKIVEKMREADGAALFKVVGTSPAQVTGKTAIVGRENTLWDGKLNILRSLFAFREKKPDGPVYGGPDERAAKLNDWYENGRAAGNFGDLYDNRDRNHANLDAAWLPQLTYIKYSSEAKGTGVDYGLNNYLFFNAITIGNASLARTNGPFWRSLPRNALIQPSGAALLSLQYVNNQLYVYPEHADHDAKFGDLYPANTPYYIISQGSSRSDKPFLHAIGAVLAAFKPETKDFLRKRRLISPTVQWIFRKGQQSGGTKEGYLSGPTHPSVFRAEDMDIGRMVDLANDLDAADVPAVPLLQVIEESEAQLGVDHFAPGTSEKLFDTSSAIARIARSTLHEQRMIVSAEQTRDPNGRALSFRWVVLRGDAERIAINALNEAGSKVEITVPWHDARRVPGRPKLTTDRVDIGLFVNNGKHYSAPAFVSFMFPSDQLREYDDEWRIQSVDYNYTAAAAGKRYVDPLLFPKRDWSDRYMYDDKGRLLGWRRMRGDTIARYTRHGARVMSTDALDRPLRAMTVRYDVERLESGIGRVVELPSEQLVTYEYKNDADTLGTAQKVTDE